MAKVGIDSFLLDCRTNENISEIEAEYGVKGFAVVVRLWQKIYSEKGYYCEWSGRSPLLFLSDWFGGNSGVAISLINQVVDRCLDNGIFNAGMYGKYSILTSARIQKQYFDVVKRREEILVKKEYLLVSVGKIKGIVYENDVSVYRNQKNVCRNSTSKVKESKVKKSKEKEYICTEPDKSDSVPPARVEHFEEFFSAYPKSINRHLAEQEYASLLRAGKITEEALVCCAENYAEWCRIKAKEKDYIKNPDNFLKDFTFEDFLPGKYKRPEKPQYRKNSFNDFSQRTYDWDNLEKSLLNSSLEALGNMEDKQ